MKKIKNFIAKFVFFLLLELFLAIILFVIPLFFNGNVFVFEVFSGFLDFIIFGIISLFVVQYLVFFSFSGLSLVKMFSMTNKKFINFWRNFFASIFKGVKNNYPFYFKLSIIVASIILTMYFLSFVGGIFNDEGQWAWIIGDNLSRSLLLIHLVWAFIKVFVVWSITISLLVLIKDKK